jgi:hypothetical protein
MEIQLQLNTRNKLSKWKLYFKIMKSNNLGVPKGVLQKMLSKNFSNKWESELFEIVTNFQVAE